jgi:hypothetical protein
VFPAGGPETRLLINYSAALPQAFVPTMRR